MLQLDSWHFSYSRDSFIIYAIAITGTRFTGPLQSSHQATLTAEYIRFLLSKDDGIH